MSHIFSVRYSLLSSLPLSKIQLQQPEAHVIVRTAQRPCYKKAKL